MERGGNIVNLSNCKKERDSCGIGDKKKLIQFWDGGGYWNIKFI